VTLVAYFSNVADNHDEPTNQRRLVVRTPEPAEDVVVMPTVIQ
jgi:hypothetical protein